MKYYTLHIDDALWSNLQDRQCSTLLFDFEKDGNVIREMYKLPKGIVEDIREHKCKQDIQLRLVDALSNEEVIFRQSALEFIVAYGTEID